MHSSLGETSFGALQYLKIGMAELLITCVHYYPVAESFPPRGSPISIGRMNWFHHHSSPEVVKIVRDPRNAQFCASDPRLFSFTGTLKLGPNLRQSHKGHQKMTETAVTPQFGHI